MVTTRTGHRDRIGQNVTMNQYNFERVPELKYLGVTITSNIDITKEISKRIQSGNCCCFALRSLMRPENISRKKTPIPSNLMHVRLGPERKILYAIIPR